MLRNIPVAPQDAIFGIKALYDASNVPNKQLLSLGVYLGEDQKFYTYPSVSKAEDRIIHKYDKNYLPMIGFPPLFEPAKQLLLGPHYNDMKHRVASNQSVAGTGGVFMTARFVYERLRDTKVVLLGAPSWPNYHPIFEAVNQPLTLYPWLKNNRFNLNGCIDAINKAPKKSLVIMQVVGHNPTGVDPTLEEWREVLAAVDKKEDYVLWDFAYMGYGSGDMDKDAAIVREYAQRGLPMFVAFSFSKCMGLYGERIGVLHTFAENQRDADATCSQMVAIGRQTYSVCPQNGALIASEILNDPELKKQWVQEVKGCAQRLIDIRKTFCDLVEKKSGHDFTHVRQQQGMFAWSGLTEAQVKHLYKKGVFIPLSGRIAIPGLNKSNVDFVAECVADALKNA